MQRRVVVVSVVIAVVVVLAGGGLLAWRTASRTPYEQAVAWMPAETLRATYTDWAAVRGLADGTDLGAASSTRDVGSFLERAYDQDLVSASAVADSTYAMNEQYGFSPVDAAWEMYGQSREGAVVVMAMTDEVDLEGVERNLRSLGYQAPAEGAGTGGTWAGSADLVATIDPSLTPVLQNVVVLPDEHVVLLSDNTSYVSSAASVVTGSAESLEDATEGTAALAELAGEPVSAMLYASDFACEALSMGSADEEDRAVAEDLVNRVGGVSPLSGLVLAMQRDRGLTVGMHFESDEQASDNVEPRVRLASGEAVGQGGTFADRFRVREGRSDGQEVVLDLVPVDQTQSLLSDLSQGPVLFATC